MKAKSIGKFAYLVRRLFFSASAFTSLCLNATEESSAVFNNVRWIELDRANYPDKHRILEVEGKGFLSMPNITEAKSDVVFASFSIQPRTNTNWEQGTLISFGSITLGYVRMSARNVTMAHLVMADMASRSAQFTPLSSALAVSTSKSEVCAFQKIMLRIDSRTNTCDIFVNGSLNKADIPVKEGAGRQSLVFFPGSDGKATIADIAIGSENPWFTDINANGIPDEFERSMGQFTASREVLRSPILLQAYITNSKNKKELHR